MNKTILTTALLSFFVVQACDSSIEEDIFANTETATNNTKSNVITLKEGDFIISDLSIEDMFISIDTSYTILKSTDSTYDGLPSDKQEFVYGGIALLSNYIGMETTIVGNQRWTTMDYFVIQSSCETTSDLEPEYIEGDVWQNNIDSLDNIVIEYESVYHFSWPTAMTIGEFSTIANVGSPDGLTEESKWRIPTQRDAKRLCYMLRKDYEAINAGLEGKATGVFYSVFRTYYECQGTIWASATARSGYTSFWTQDYEEEYSTLYPIYSCATFNDENFITGQICMFSPHMPIRLVQDIAELE